MTAPGQVRFVADTGDCRDARRVDTTDPAAAGVDRAPVQAVLERLGLTGGRLDAPSAVACPDGGVVGTVEVAAPAR